MLFDVGRGVLDGVAADIGKTARESTEAEGRKIGVGAGDFHVLDAHAQFFRGDLAHRRVHALAAFAFAAENQSFTVFVDLDRCRAAVVVAEVAFAADVHGAGQAESGVWLFVRSLGFPVDHLFGHVEALLELAAGDAIAVRRNVADFGGVHARDFHRIDAEGVSAEIDGLLHRPLGGWIAEAAERAGGNFVGVNQFGVDLHVGIFIASVVAHRRDAGNRRRLGRIGAVVGDDF